MKAPPRTAWLGSVALLVVGCAGSADTAVASADQGYVAADGAIAEVYLGPPLTDATLRRLVRDELGVDVG